VRSGRRADRAPGRAPRRAGAAAAFALAGALGLAGAAGAVVISTGDGSGNTSAPPDDPGFANVGNASGLSGVYLRDGWVLTASHVGEGAITLDGVTYPPVVGSKIRLAHDATHDADLIVYRIEGLPPLPFPHIATRPAAVGEEIVAIGKGWNREAAVTAWDDQWAEVPLPGVYRGFKKGSGGTMRWGRNVIDWVDLDFDYNGLRTRYFAMDFDETGGLPDEMQAVPGDSGGAVFVKRGGRWELAGILFIRLTEDANQPANTAVFGNGSGAIDLYHYRDQILALTQPQVPALPPWPGLALAAAIAAAALPALAGRRRASRAAGGTGLP
jgi:Trypsin